LQEILSKEKITILSLVDEEFLFPGATCMAVYPSTGMWYECSIEKRLSLDEAEKFAATDMRSA
jgi:hypothetical protein